jgi:radical SAM superfamily enzyme YgiQ (UPF0313 family)
MTFLPPQELTKRIRVLRDRGAREIRFVDPTLNAHPFFSRILGSLAGLNKTGPIRFFAEVRAETLLPEQIDILASAGFKEVEVGVQAGKSLPPGGESIPNGLRRNRGHP